LADVTSSTTCEHAERTWQSFRYYEGLKKIFLSKN
jgi:hypothetical protein